jgi:hypothetical protein
VYDLCKSEIVTGKDELRSVSTKKEVGFSIPGDLRDLLETYGCDLPTWELIKFVLDEQRWGEKIILSHETVGDETTGKVLTVVSGDRFMLESYISRETIE